MIILTDILKEPMDEGGNNAAVNLIKQIKLIGDSYIISVNSDAKFPFVDRIFKLNKLFINLLFYKIIKNHQDDNMLYIPKASISLFSFIRAKLLGLFTGKNIYLLSLQPRLYGSVSKSIINIIPPKCVIVQSKKNAQYLSKLCLKTTNISLGVDDKKYFEYDYTNKKILRIKYKIQRDRIVLLHVGHIQKSRNLEWLIKIKERCHKIEVIFVSSSYNQNDEDIYIQLLSKGIRVIREYIPNMEDIYNLADYYIFPVIRNDGAIGTPLSVLEAMACNLPVITTKFGSLPDIFDEDEYFRWVESSEEIIELIKEGRVYNCNNRQKIDRFTWGRIADKIYEIVGN